MHTLTWLGVSCRLRCDRLAGSHPADAASAAGCVTDPWTQHASLTQGLTAPGSEEARALPEPAAGGPF